MLIEKEVIRPGTYWYEDKVTGLPRKLVATPEFVNHMHEQGNKMLSMGLTVPVPIEHDFNAHPMTPADKLKNNAGWVKEFRIKDNALFSVLDIQDEEIVKKLPKTIRWTSPWINSFTDGNGNKWNNVVSHLALTTRPRITKQAPFTSIAAAMSFAEATPEDILDLAKPHGTEGFAISKAGRLKVVDNKLLPEYPVAFSLYTGGIALSDEDMDESQDDDPPMRKKGEGSKDQGRTGKNKNDPDGKKDDGGEPKDDKGAGIPKQQGALDDQNGDVTMPQLLSDLMSVLGVQLPDNIGSEQFMRALYIAVINKIKETAGQQQHQHMKQQMGQPGQPGPGQQKQPGNPIVQEQQPMYMSLEDINKIEDKVTRDIALSMYTENKKNSDALAATNAKLASLTEAKLKEEGAKRQLRIDRLCRMSPSVKKDIEAMLALPSMALSMGEAGTVVDPMAQTLAVLEKGLQDIPRLLQEDKTGIIEQPQPTDGQMLSQEQEDRLVDEMSRMMGCPTEAKKAG